VVEVSPSSDDSDIVLTGKNVGDRVLKSNNTEDNEMLVDDMD
jgi:hypothetical protein